MTKIMDGKRLAVGKPLSTMLLENTMMSAQRSELLKSQLMI